MTIQGMKIESAAPVATTTASSAAHQAQNAIRSVQAAVAAELDHYIRDSQRSVEFRVDAGANATVITVRRADTGEVVRQYPTEEALALLRRLNEQSGTLLDAFA